MDNHLLRFRKDVTYCYIDCETFNLALHFSQNRIWQVATLFVQGDRVLDEQDIRIKLEWPDAPELSIGAGAAAVTRFNKEEHQKLAIDHETAFNQFWPMLQKADYVIGHNLLNFDIYLIKGWAELMGVDWKWLPKKIIDTKSIAFGIKTNNPYNPKDSLLEYQYRMGNTFKKGIKTNLTALGKEYGIEHDYDNLHNALCDLLLNFKVWQKMKYQIEL